MTAAAMPLASEASEPLVQGMDRDKFAARLIHFRTLKGLSRPQLSKQSGVGVRSLESWEQGRREPGAFDLSLVAAVLGVTVEQLVSNEAPDPPPSLPRGPGRPKHEPDPAPPAAKRPRKRRDG